MGSLLCVCFPEEGSISLRFLSSGGPAILEERVDTVAADNCLGPSIQIHGGSAIDMVCKEPCACIVGGCLGEAGLLTKEQAFQNITYPQCPENTVPSEVTGGRLETWQSLGVLGESSRFRGKGSVAETFCQAVLTYLHTSRAHTCF